MNRIIRKHIIFWGLYFGIEILAYFKSWGSRFWMIALVNISLALIGFYICYFFGKRLYYKLKNELPVKKIIYFKDFWRLITTVIVFLCLRLIGDLIIFNPNSGVSIPEYLVSLSRVVLSIAIPGMLIGIGKRKEEIIIVLNKKQRCLETTIATLEPKVIHLTSTIETKERVIQEMDRQMNDLILRNEVLARENERLKEGNEILQLNRTGLEEDISGHQNLILVLKAELLGGQEDYRQLALRYDALFDFYRRQLDKYRNLYGRLNNDDEEEPE